MIVKEISILLCYDICLCYVSVPKRITVSVKIILFLMLKECAKYVLIIYVFHFIVLFIPTAPDMFIHETCDEIKWCQSGGKFPLDIWV